MKIIITGVGRSGTSNLYSFIYNILRHREHGFASIYEPFLWGGNVWNKSYEDLGPGLSDLNNVTPAGIYAHGNLPMFLESKADYDWSFAQKYLQRIKNKKSDFLYKFIRAGGRNLLLEEIVDDGTVIILMRHPVSVVNSLGDHFSHFGEGYYPSDFQRFRTECESIFGDEYIEYEKKLKKFGVLGAQVLYWHFTNRHIVSQMQAGKYKRSKIYFYEEFVSNPELVLRNLLEVLSIPWRENYVDIYTRKSGHLTKKQTIPLEMLQVMKESLEFYRKTMDQYGLLGLNLSDGIVSRFGKKNSKSFLSFKNVSGNSLTKLVFQLKGKNQALAVRIDQLEKRRDALSCEIHQYAMQIAIHERRDSARLKRIRDVESRLSDYRSIIRHLLSMPFFGGLLAYFMKKQNAGWIRKDVSIK
tara:strand:- start:635 stop:1873 length:1239 start_codon:yes stop_codon:yes gene_type:complete